MVAPPPIPAFLAEEGQGLSGYGQCPDSLGLVYFLQSSEHVQKADELRQIACLFGESTPGCSNSAPPKDGQDLQPVPLVAATHVLEGSLLYTDPSGRVLGPSSQVVATVRV